MHQILGPRFTAISEDVDKRGSGIKETSFFCVKLAPEENFVRSYFIIRNLSVNLLAPEFFFFNFSTLCI